MKVGDLVIHHFVGNELASIQPDKQIGIITHLWGACVASVLFEDGEYDVDSDDLEVICESL